MVEAASLRDRALAVLEQVTDPEIPVLTIADLGILRDVSVQGDTVDVTITPTYSGCPAMNLITVEIETALARPASRRASAPRCRRRGPPIG